MKTKRRRRTRAQMEELRRIAAMPPLRFPFLAFEKEVAGEFDADDDESEEDCAACEECNEECEEGDEICKENLCPDLKEGIPDATKSYLQSVSGTELLNKEEEIIIEIGRAHV